MRTPLRRIGRIGWMPVAIGGFVIAALPGWIGDGEDVAAIRTAVLHLAPSGRRSSHALPRPRRPGQSGVTSSLTENAMLQQILIHTPIYVWAILAVLVWRGTAALREREMKVRSLFIVPIVMLALSLQDVLMKFGSNAMALAVWAAAATGMALLVWKFGRSRTAPGSAPGSVIVRGSWVPLAMMMAVFFTRYAASVLLAILPHARQDVLFAAGVCALSGVFSGCFVGGLARDVAGQRGLNTARNAFSAAGW
jgi:hypothetical protein